MNLDHVTIDDAKKIQSILEYIQKNGVIHKNVLPEALSHIEPEKYKEYKEAIFKISPLVVENPLHSDNLGIPATENLEPYLLKGGFMKTYNEHRQIADGEKKDKQIINQLEQQIQSNEAALLVSKKANRNAVIAIIIAVMALLFQVVKMIFN